MEACLPPPSPIGIAGGGGNTSLHALQSACKKWEKRRREGRRGREEAKKGRKEEEKRWKKGKKRGEKRGKKKKKRGGGHKQMHIEQQMIDQTKAH